MTFSLLAASLVCELLLHDAIRRQKDGYANVNPAAPSPPYLIPIRRGAAPPLEKAMDQRQSKMSVMVLNIIGRSTRQLSSLTARIQNYSTARC